METVKRDLHQSTAQCSALLTRYSKLAASASTSYSASGLVKDDLSARRTELEDEISAAFSTVSCPPSLVSGLLAVPIPVVVIRSAPLLPPSPSGARLAWPSGAY